MDAQFELKDLKGVIRRRKKSLIIPFLLILLTSGTVAFILPPIYRAETKILVEGQQIPQDYVKSTITSYVEERLQVITYQVMSRAKLMGIINHFNLYPEMRDRNTTEEVIEKMRKDIKFETVSANIIDKRTGRPSIATIAFTLSYEGKNPSIVQKVANVLASLYLEEDLKTREKQASNTTDFLQEELKQLEKQIRVDENKISEFKKAHFGQLPAHNIVNLQAIERLERELDRVDMDVRSLEERKVYLTGQIATVDPLNPVMIDGKKMVMNPKENLKGLRLQLITLQSNLSEKHPDVMKLKNEIMELEAQVGKTDDAVIKVKRLKELEGQLAVAKGKLGPRHPDVIRLSKEMGFLSKEVDALLTERATTEVAEEKPDNPTYISLMTQIVSSDMRIKGLLLDTEKIKKSLEKYRRKVEIAPLVEKEYLELTRDYESAKYKYNEILNKLMTAKVAQGMEETQRGERFTITDPATLPEKPYKPNRVAIVLIGFILAMGAGVGLAATQEFMDTSVKTADELNNITGVPVFSVISLIETDEERRIRLIKRVILILAGIGLILGALVLVDRFYMPLEILWIKMQRRMMLMGFPF